MPGVAPFLIDLPAVVGDDENYSDVLTVTGDLAWAVLGESIAYPSGAPR